MKYYSQYRSHDLFELQDSLSGLSKSNRWVKLADHLPWDRIEREYNKRLRNSHNGAGNKPARMVVGALIVKHVEKLSDEKTIQAIQENPYMQYLLGLEKCTEKPVFVPEFFVFGNYRLLIGEFYLNLQRRDNVIDETTAMIDASRFTIYTNRFTIHTNI